MGEMLPPVPEPPPPGLPAHLASIFALHALAPDTFHIDILAVAPELRGGGIGTRMLRFAAPFAGPRGLSLIVSDANTRAHALYRRDGFRDEARRPILRPDMARTGDHWVLMVRPPQVPGS